MGLTPPGLGHLASRVKPPEKSKPLFRAFPHSSIWQRGTTGTPPICQISVKTLARTLTNVCRNHSWPWVYKCSNQGRWGGYFFPSQHHRCVSRNEHRCEGSALSRTVLGCFSQQQFPRNFEIVATAIEEKQLCSWMLLYSYIYVLTHYITLPCGSRAWIDVFPFFEMLWLVHSKYYVPRRDR